MSIRETIEKKPAVSTAVVIALMLVAGYMILRSQRQPSINPGSAFYTTDDGQTTFIDNFQLRAPFDHDGKTAYRIMMFTCDGGKTKFSGYLERYTPQAKSRLEAPDAQAKAEQTHIPLMIWPSDIEVKKPGSQYNWVNSANVQQAAQITNVTCPDGRPTDVVWP